MYMYLSNKALAATLALWLGAVPVFPKDKLDLVPPGNWGAVEILEEGTPVSIRMVSGDKMDGKFLDLDSDAIHVIIDDQERVFPRSGVAEIWQLRVPDGKLNGVLIGMGAGLAAGIIAASAGGALNTGDTAGRQWGAGLILAGIGLGAVLGAVTDASIKGKRLLYRK